jgi:hypothetical protein
MLVKKDLPALSDPRRPFAALLDLLEIVFTHPPGAQFGAQKVRRRNRILDRKIDPDASDRRHRVSAVANAEKARAMPFLEPVYFYGQELDGVPITQLFEPVAEKGRSI